MTKRILIFALLPVLLAGGCQEDTFFSGIMGGDAGSNGLAPIIGGDTPRRPLRDVINPLFGAPGQPLAGAGFFDALVVNDSSSAATVALKFVLLKRLVHETVLHDLVPGTTTLIAGPERATHLIANSVSATGLHYPEGRFVFGVDVDEQTPAVYRIQDPVIEPPAPPQPDVDTTGVIDVDTTGTVEIDTTGIEEEESNGGGGGGGEEAIPDCNSNGIDDRDEVAQGSAPDCNTDGIPDECQFGEPLPMNPSPADPAQGEGAGAGVQTPEQPPGEAGSGKEPLQLCILRENDRNGNCVLDECETGTGFSEDVNSNGIPNQSTLPGLEQTVLGDTLP